MEERILTANEKAQMVIRLFKGDEAAVVAEEARVPVVELLTWRDVFLSSGTEALGGGGQVRGWRERGLEGVITADSAPDCDSFGLDWQLGSEQLERMVTTVREFISEQQKLRSL